MTQALSKPLTFEEFLEWYPEDGRRYELIEGEIVEMRPVGQHELIASFIDAELTLEIRRLQLPLWRKITSGTPWSPKIAAIAAIATWLMEN